MPNENTEYVNKEDELPDHLENVVIDENGDLHEVAEPASEKDAE